MNRRDFIGHTATLGVIAAAVTTLPASVTSVGNAFAVFPDAGRLTPPAKGKIPVAFAISQGVTVIDFAGPWEVFQDVMINSRGKDMDEQMPFELFTVSEKTESLTGSGGLKLVPDYTFATAPEPKVVVVPAQRGSEALHVFFFIIRQPPSFTLFPCTTLFRAAGGR